MLGVCEGSDGSEDGSEGGADPGSDGGGEERVRLSPLLLHESPLTDVVV